MHATGEADNEQLIQALQQRLTELENRDDALSRQYEADLRAYLKLLSRFGKVLAISDKYQELLTGVKHSPSAHPDRAAAGMAGKGIGHDADIELESLLEHPEAEVRNLATHHARLLRQMRKIMMISDGYLKELRDASLRLELVAKTDGLTELTNRRGMIEKLEIENARSLRAGSSMAVILVDIDDFKNVNDSHGHDIGDQVLKTVARLLQENLRRSDSCARWGGEEFIILCPECGWEQAGVVAEKCRNSIAGIIYPTPQGSMKLSISCGVSCADKGTPEWEELLKQADIAMYRAKAAGKNRVVLFQP